jgi:hypothetical protein
MEEMVVLRVSFRSKGKRGPMAKPCPGGGGVGEEKWILEKKSGIPRWQLEGGSRKGAS